MDPAGPLYYFLNNHLSISDADFVDVIHTDMGFAGLALRIGTVNFFPNYGRRPQPGCSIGEYKTHISLFYCFIIIIYFTLYKDIICFFKYFKYYFLINLYLKKLIECNINVY